jgi:PilZ domain
MSAPGVILDLSSNGCRAQSASESSIGESLGVLIDVPRYENPLHVTRAVVRWSKGQEFGIEFMQLEADDQQRLRQLIGHMAVDTVVQNQNGYSARPD